MGSIPINKIQHEMTTSLYFSINSFTLTFNLITFVNYEAKDSCPLLFSNRPITRDSWQFIFYNHKGLWDRYCWNQARKKISISLDSWFIFQLYAGMRATNCRRNSSHSISPKWLRLDCFRLSTLVFISFYSVYLIFKKPICRHSSQQTGHYGCRITEYVVECAREQSSCYGARMTGAGFGGCAVALVAEEKTTEFVKAVSAAYKQRSGLEASIYVCKASEGASILQG